MDEGMLGSGPLSAISYRGPGTRTDLPSRRGRDKLRHRGTQGLRRLAMGGTRL